MTDWTGLLPVLAFALTVGVFVSVALTAHLSHQSGARPFARPLRVAFLQTALLYLLGVFVLWSLSARLSRTLTLLVVSALTALLLAALPLLVAVFENEQAAEVLAVHLADEQPDYPESRTTP